MELRSDYLLNFPLWFTINDVGSWLFIIGAMGLGLMVAGQKIYMENRVNLHR
jgi:hypothetical protein